MEVEEGSVGTNGSLTMSASQILDYFREHGVAEEEIEALNFEAKLESAEKLSVRYRQVIEEAYPIILEEEKRSKTEGAGPPAWDSDFIAATAAVEYTAKQMESHWVSALNTFTAIDNKMHHLISNCPSAMEAEYVRREIEKLKKKFPLDEIGVSAEDFESQAPEDLKPHPEDTEDQVHIKMLCHELQERKIWTERLNAQEEQVALLRKVLEEKKKRLEFVSKHLSQIKKAADPLSDIFDTNSNEEISEKLKKLPPPLYTAYQRLYSYKRAYATEGLTMEIVESTLSADKPNEADELRQQNLEKLTQDFILRYKDSEPESASAVSEKDPDAMIPEDMEEDEVDYSGAEESDAETKPATPAPGVANVEQMLPEKYFETHPVELRVKLSVQQAVIIVDLTYIPNLKIVAATSSMSFSGSDELPSGLLSAANNLLNLFPGDDGLVPNAPVAFNDQICRPSFSKRRCRAYRWAQWLCGCDVAPEDGKMAETDAMNHDVEKILYRIYLRLRGRQSLASTISDIKRGVFGLKGFSIQPPRKITKFHSATSKDCKDVNLPFRSKSSYFIIKFDRGNSASLKCGCEVNSAYPLLPPVFKVLNSDESDPSLMQMLNEVNRVVPSNVKTDEDAVNVFASMLHKLSICIGIHSKASNLKRLPSVREFKGRDRRPPFVFDEVTGTFSHRSSF